MTHLPRLMILGHARHGKDTVCEKLRDKYGFKFVSSSWFMAERVVWPATTKAWDVFRSASPIRRTEPAFPYYQTAEECYADRHNHRAFWYDHIAAFNANDPSSLTREIYAAGFDIYAGLRNARELHHGRLNRAFDIAVWVNAADRVSPESRSSCTVEPWMADVILDNNGLLEDLDKNLEALYNNWIRPLLVSSYNRSIDAQVDGVICPDCFNKTQALPCPTCNPQAKP